MLADGRPIARAILHSGPIRALISGRHERDQDPLGPGAPHRLCCALLRLGSHGVGCVASCFPTTARPPVVRGLRLAALPTSSGLLMVVRLRRLYKRLPRSLRRTSRQAGNRTQATPAAVLAQTRAAPARIAKRFQGTVTLDSTRVGRDAGRIADEVIAHLRGWSGPRSLSRLRLRRRFPLAILKMWCERLTENCRTLRFTSQGFEEE